MLVHVWDLGCELIKEITLKKRLVNQLSEDEVTTQCCTTNNKLGYVLQGVFGACA
jgi:hypothetical protein